MKRNLKIFLLVAALAATSVTGCGMLTEGARVEESTIQDSVPGVGEDTLIASIETGENIERNYITMEYQFYSESEEPVEYEFPATVEQEGKTYRFTGDVRYETLESMNVVAHTADLEVKEQEEIEKTLMYTSEETGRTYELYRDLMQVSEQTVISMKVTDTVTYSPQPDKPYIPNTKIITYYNEVTGQDEQIEGTLVRSGKYGDTTWQDGYDFDGLFTTASEDTTEWTLEGIGDVVVEQNADIPVWDNYQSDIPIHFGLDTGKYRVTGAAWDGETYLENNLRCRKAVYTGEALVTGYTATYEGIGQAYGYEAHVTYYVPAEEADAPKEDVSTIYKMLAIGSYEEVPATVMN